MEVARVSLVDMKGRVMMDQYVMPRYEVLDFNTAFSGVEPEHLENAINLEPLLQYIIENTILAGHSFEMDLKGLRIPHRTIIDTAVLFSNGLDTPKSAFSPKKPALQALVSEFLGRNTQGNETKHS